jgi:hypothetical protein
MRHLYLPLLMLIPKIKYAVFAADTWLHLTTFTVAFSKVQAVSELSMFFGRGLSPICYITNSTQSP